MLLGDVAEIRAGHPFRGKIPEIAGGDAYVVQIRDIDENGLISWDTLIATEIKGRKSPDWLQQGDILFTARGYRNIAAFVDYPPANTLSAPHYFVIRVHNKNILPEFVTWQLNQIPAQKYFTKSSQGTVVANIPRDFLATTPLIIPPIEEQITLVGLAKAQIKEKLVLQAMIKNRELQMQEIAKRLLTEML